MWSEHGRNQIMGSIRLDYTLSGGNIDDGRTITVNYSNLRITTDEIAFDGADTGPALECGGGFGTSNADTQHLHEYYGYCC